MSEWIEGVQWASGRVAFVNNVVVKVLLHDI